MTDPATLERLALAAGFDLAHPAAWGEIGENNLGRPVWIGASINPPAEPSYRYAALHTLTAEKLARFAELVRAAERADFDAAVHERVGLHLASSLQAGRMRAIVRSGATDEQIGEAVRKLAAERIEGQDAFALVRADERQRCAKVCEAAWPEMHKYWGQGQARAACEDCAAAIRAIKDAP